MPGDLGIFLKKKKKKKKKKHDNAPGLMYGSPLGIASLFLTYKI